MAHRVIDITTPTDRADVVAEAIESAGGCVQLALTSNGKTLTRVVTEAEASESIVDAVQSAVGSGEEISILVMALEAALPRRESEDDGAGGRAGPESVEGADGAQPKSLGRISRDELLDDLENASKVNLAFIAMTASAAVLALVGMHRDSPVIVIGSMVIAPLLGPTMGLALALTLGDYKFVGRVLRANAIGFSIAVVISAVAGFLLPLDVQAGEVASRVNPGAGDVLIAVAAGVAGALAFTSGVGMSVIGVMVAVALLPPTVAAGALVGSGEWGDALQAALLLGLNVCAINLAGMATFVAQGIRPRLWWEASRAQRVSRYALIAWLVVFAAVVALVVLVDTSGG